MIVDISMCPQESLKDQQALRMLAETMDLRKESSAEHRQCPGSRNPLSLVVIMIIILINLIIIVIITIHIYY